MWLEEERVTDSSQERVVEKRREKEREREREVEGETKMQNE